MYKLCFTHFEMKSFLHADKRSIVRIFIIFSYLFIHLFILMQQTSRVENINQSGNTHCINIHSPGVSGAIGNTFQLLRSARILCRIKVSGIAWKDNWKQRWQNKPRALFEFPFSSWLNLFIRMYAIRQ